MCRLIVSKSAAGVRPVRNWQTLLEMCLKENNQNKSMQVEWKNSVWKMLPNSNVLNSWQLRRLTTAYVDHCDIATQIGEWKLGPVRCQKCETKHHMSINSYMFGFAWEICHWCIVLHSNFACPRCSQHALKMRHRSKIRFESTVRILEASTLKLNVL